MENDPNFKEALLRAGVTLNIMQQLGFEYADECTLPLKLRNIKPNGSTSMRDAVMTGIKLILDLNNVLAKLGTNNVWNFVHIVLTDGEDNASKSTLNDSLNVMSLIKQKINVNALKTYFIGVDIKQNATASRELKSLAHNGGDNAEFLDVSGVEISQIFEKIKISLGIYQRTEVVGVQTQNFNLIAAQQKIDPVLLLKAQKYVVLFTLDMSGSMSGTKWNQVCESVSNFVKYLGKDDLVAGIVFNEKVLILLNQNQQQSNNYIPPKPNDYTAVAVRPQPHYQPQNQPQIKYQNKPQPKAQPANNRCSQIIGVLMLLVIVALAIYIIFF